MLKRINVSAKYLLNGLLSLLYPILSIVTLRLELFALARITTERAISEANAVELKALVILALASPAATSTGFLRLFKEFFLSDCLF